MDTHTYIKLISSNGDELIFYNNKCLYNEKAPIQTIQKKIERLELPSKRLIVWFSPLLFYGYDELINKIPEDSTLIAIELVPELAELSIDTMQQRDIHLPFYTSLPQIESLIKKNHNIRGIHELRLTRIAEHSQLYVQIKNTLTNGINTYWKNRLTSMHMAKLWLKNILFNISRSSFNIMPSNTGCLYPDALVVGAGVSTELHIDSIRSYKGCIIAVDTAVRCLQAHKIVPDYVIALEGQFYNVDDISGFDSRNSTLLADICSSPVLIDNWKGDIAFFSTRFQALQILDSIYSTSDILKVPALGSVGVTAVHIAGLFAAQVFTVGLDFSYPPGKTHARSTPTHDTILHTHNKTGSMLSSLKSSYMRESTPINNGFDSDQWISDSVLSSYVQHLQPYKTTKLGSEGLLDKEISLELPAFSGPSEPISMKSMGKMDSILQDLASELKKGETEIRKAGDSMLHYLFKNDFLTADFPDPPTFELTKNPLYIKRVLQSLYYYKGLIEKLI